MWDKLSIKDKAEIIKMGVANGIRDLDTIRDTYNNIYAEGGDTNLLNNQDFLNQYGIHWDEDPLMNDYYAQHPSELNKSTTAGMPAAYNNRVLVNRYGVPQSQQSLNRYAKDYALIQPQVSRKEEREVEKRAIDRNIEQNMSQAPLLFSGLSFLNLASPSNIYGTVARQVNPDYYGQDHNWTEDLIFGNAGLFTDKWAEEHPYLSTLGNMGTDIATGAGIVKGVNVLNKTASAYRNVVPKVARQIAEYQGNKPYTSSLKAISKLLNPKYVRVLDSAPQEMQDLMHLNSYKNFSRKGLQKFSKVFSEEMEKGKFQPKALISRGLYLSDEGVNTISDAFKGARKTAIAENKAKDIAINTAENYKKIYNQLDPILQHIADTSPQYMDELFEQQIKHGGATEEFVRDLINKANSYRRVMNRQFSAEDYRTFRGSGLGRTKDLRSIDVEGEMMSGNYGQFPAYFQGQPELTGDMATWWDQRIPKGVIVKEGMHSRSPLIESFSNTFGKDANFAIRAFWENYNGPRNFVSYPYHQVFLGQEGTLLPNFKVTVKNMPEGFTFGKGYKQGGKLIKK